jgi:hypothetical protein
MFLAFGSATALAQADQDKLYYDATNGWILYYTDTDVDGWHDPGEAFFAAPGGTDWNPDNSCWMASASNLMVTEGLGNQYNPPWLQNGAAPSPCISPWGAVVTAPGGGVARTFDDGGWQHWALAFAALKFQGPIITTTEFGAPAWLVNPITWSKDRINEGHAVGLTVWWGSPKSGRLPGRVEKGAVDGYHAITLYEINDVAGTVTITDSDDGVAGTRVCNYSYTVIAGRGDWVIQNLYSGINVHVNYAVALMSTGPETINHNVILIDRSGSMHANTRSTGNSRFKDAVEMAKSDVQAISEGEYIAVAYFDFDYISGIDRIYMTQDFTTTKQEALDAIDAIPGPPGGYTNLADAMCVSADWLTDVTAQKHLYIYTDGYENASDAAEENLCDGCDSFAGTAWYYDCDPTDQVTHPCSDWQNCVATSLTGAAIVTVHYFGEPITKAVSIDYASMSEETIKGTPDMYFLKFIAEKSGGMFHFVADNATAPVMNGDVNCDGVVNMMDILYLISFLYRGGLTPCGF